MSDSEEKRQIVQKGLDERAAIRAEKKQEEEDDRFLDILNELTEKSREMTEGLENARQLARKNRREERMNKALEEETAHRADRFQQQIFIALAIVAAAVGAYTIKAMTLWLPSSV